jgi:chitin disaccharide deacetylase
MKYLVVVADDFGVSQGANKGCLEAYEQGMVTELSLMMRFPGTQEAAQLIENHKIANVGIHLTLNNFNESNKYYRTNDYLRLLDSLPSDEVHRLITEELDAFENLVGRPPTHITSHQHIHQHSKMVKVVGEYAGKHNLFVRRAKQQDYEKEPLGNIADVNKQLQMLGARVTDHVFAQVFDDYTQAKSQFLEKLNMVRNGEITEIFFHPAYVDDFLKNYSSMKDERVRDLQLAKDANFIEQIKTMGFEITSFSQLALAS